LLFVAVSLIGFVVISFVVTRDVAVVGVVIVVVVAVVMLVLLLLHWLYF
jgi:hypothetical protein